MKLDVLDLAVRYLMATTTPVRFIEVGAHDGVTFDPIRPYVEAYGWRGFCVEPHPDNFARLQANCKPPGAKVSCVQAAICEHDGDVDLYAFPQDAGLPYHASMLPSLIPTLHMNSHGYTGEIRTFVVPCMTPATFMARYAAGHRVDLLQVDAEGMDQKIVHGFLDAGVRPTVIHFENPDHSEPAWLVSEYDVSHDGIDTLAILRFGSPRRKRYDSVTQEFLSAATEGTR